MSDQLRAIDLDVCDQLRSCEPLADVFITTSRPRLQTIGGVMQSVEELQPASVLAGGFSGDYKGGAAIIVGMPYIDVDRPNIPGPLGQLIVPVFVLTVPTYNFGTGGVGLSPEELGAFVLRAHAPVNFEGTTSMAITPAPSAMQELPGDFLKTVGLEPKEVVGYTVRLQTGVHLTVLDRPPRPTILNAANEITLACSNGSAEIYYTLDGGFPGPGNAAAVLYAAPFDITPPVTVRFASFLIVPSSVGALEVAS